MRLNADLDAQESESQLRADMDRDQIERVLQNEEDAVNTGILAATSLGTTIPMLSSPHVAFSVQDNSGPPVAVSLSGPAIATALGSRSPNQLDHSQLFPQAGHGQPGSNTPFLPPLSRSNVAATQNFTVAPTLPTVPQPLGYSLGIAPTQVTTMLTSSIPSFARPLSSTQRVHTPSAAATQGTTALDPVREMGKMLKEFKVDLLSQVNNMVESRSSPGTHAPHRSPNSSRNPHQDQMDHFHRDHRSASQRRSRESYGSSPDEDRIKQIKGFKLVMDARNPEYFDGKIPALYLPWKVALEAEVSHLALTSTQWLDLLKIRTEGNAKEAVLRA